MVTELLIIMFPLTLGIIYHFSLKIFQLGLNSAKKVEKQVKKEVEKPQEPIEKLEKATEERNETMNRIFDEWLNGKVEG